MSKIIYQGQELYHHGILGQKWGVRNYQNEDGSLTPEGRERYGYSNKLFKTEKIRRSEEKTNYKNYRTKNKELKKIYKQGDLSKNKYAELKRENLENLNNKEYKSAAKYLKNETYSNMVVKAGINAVSGLGMIAVGKILGDDNVSLGKQVAGSILQGAGAGVIVGGTEGWLFNAAAKAANSKNKNMN